jgi:hypothetical protein
MAVSLEEAAARWFTVTRLPPNRSRGVRTTNAIDRFHQKFKR